MSRATVELDFFGMDQHHHDAAAASSSSSKSQFQKFLQRPRSFRGIHTAMSKINPEAFKSVIASGNANPSVPNTRNSLSVPSSPKAEQVPFPCLPLYVPPGTSVSSFTAAASESHQETTPLTIFYKGTVSVFDVPCDKAESILKLALEGNSGKATKAAVAVDPKLALHPSDQHQEHVDPLSGYLPITRSKSLQRFLEKRKERLNSGSPYASQT